LPTELLHDVEVRPYAAYDLFWLETTVPRGWFSVSTLRHLVDPSLSVSFMEHERYLGSAGMFQLWPGVYEAWLVLLSAPSSPWRFMGLLKRAIQQGQDLTGAHRLQAYCLAEYTQGLRLAQRMGFTKEAVLRCATPSKTDLIVLAKVRP